MAVNCNKRQRPMLAAGCELLPDIWREIVRCQIIAHDFANPVAAAVIRSLAIPVQAIETPDGPVSTRPEQDEDDPFLFALFESVKGPDFALLPEVMKAQLLRMQYRAMVQSYRGSMPAACFDIVTLRREPVGRLITDASDRCLDIVYISLLPSWRGRGIATALMRCVLSHADALGLPSRATVALDNVASLRLWASLGFIERSRNDTDACLKREVP
jgi:GNAT superfamily N-acetyltransferase